MIRIEKLNKYFNRGRSNEIHVINDVSLSLPERGMVAIFGKSGCGKTTLLNVIGGLDGFASGSVTLAGESVRNDPDRIRNEYVGYIFQNYNLLNSETCFDNVAAALRLCGVTDEEQIASRVTAALAAVGMDKYAKRTPDTLSGGQQQRIAIARAIVKNPRIILADEPTGNLDEANTVMVMDLLKAIAKEHLVLLVTHEENLVDHYCDTVIELKDGKVVNTRTNESADGYVARDKNDVYLGDLARRELSDENASVTYFGDTPDTPVRLTLVNHEGKLYLRVDGGRVQILDEGSEVRLREGSYEEHKARGAERSIDMHALPPVKGEHHGRLFSFFSAMKSGYTANFKNRKRGKRVLRACMCLFAAVVVFMSAVFGGAFGKILTARESYNHNVFYLYTPDASVSQRLAAGSGDPATGIDDVRLTGGYPQGDSWLTFRVGSFETFTSYDYSSNFTTHAVYHDMAQAKGLPLVAGRSTELRVEEMLITTAVADELLARATLGYVREYSDLIGLVSTHLFTEGKSLCIAGVVENDEPAAYLSSMALARQVHAAASPLTCAPAKDYGIALSEGEAVLAIRYGRSDVKYPKAGETVKLGGRDVLVKEVRIPYESYEEFLAKKGYKRPSESAWFTAYVKAENPSLEEGSAAFSAALAAAREERYAEYLDACYLHLDEFIDTLAFFDGGSFEFWLARDRGIDIVKYLYAEEDYYRLSHLRGELGRDPSRGELSSLYVPDMKEQLEKYRMAYEQAYYNANQPNGIYSSLYLVSDADYVAFSKHLGETHPSALPSGGNVSFGEPIGGIMPYAEARADVSIDVEYIGSWRLTYSVIHSTDPEATAAWLKSEFADVKPPNEYQPVLLTPDDFFELVLAGEREEVIVSLVTMLVILLLMSVCMYFIMRSSLLSRIKEVGIYRAIGVSRRNLVFRFLVEAGVLTALTVLIGYLLTSAFLGACLSMSSLVAEIFYFPLWLALADLVILAFLGIFFGTLPILSLLRKTPSEILAKYDI